MRRISKVRQTWMAGLCCGLGLLLTSVLPAQQPGADRAQKQQPQAQRQAGQKQICLVTNVIGMKIKAKGDEACGQIQNLIINSEGQVEYLALSTGAAGQSATSPQDRTRQQPGQPAQPADQAGAARTANQATGKLTLVPWDLVEVQAGQTPAEHSVSIDIEKAQLEKAPSFTEQQLMSPQQQAQLTAQVDQFFNERQSRGAARPELDREREQQKPESRQPNQPQSNN